MLVFALLSCKNVCGEFFLRYLQSTEEAEELNMRWTAAKSLLSLNGKQEQNEILCVRFHISGQMGQIYPNVITLKRRTFSFKGKNIQRFRGDSS